jgi:hypothetical protein
MSNGSLRGGKTYSTTKSHYV